MTDELSGLSASSGPDGAAPSCHRHQAWCLLWDISPIIGAILSSVGWHWSGALFPSCLPWHLASLLQFCIFSWSIVLGAIHFFFPICATHIITGDKPCMTFVSCPSSHLSCFFPQSPRYSIFARGPSWWTFSLSPMSLLSVCSYWLFCSPLLQFREDAFRCKMHFVILPI